MATNKLIGYCGLDCEKCDARIATLNDDAKLRQKTAALWSKLNNAEITKDMINCIGCRINGVHTPFCGEICHIRKCAMNKKFNTCADCEKIHSCETLGAITNKNKQALKNLKQTLE